MYRCELCKDTGWIERRREDGSRTYRPCKCREIERSKGEWKSAGINLELSDMTSAIGYFKQFQNIWKTRHNSIMFLGQVGSGKTHISIALAINLLKSKVNVVYMPYRDSIAAIKQTIMDKETYMKNLLKFKQCQVLLIDDLYKGKVSSYDINIMFEIINYRYLKHLPVIVSSELSIGEILNYDEAVGSRLYEMSRDFIITMDKGAAENYRLR